MDELTTDRCGEILARGDVGHLAVIAGDEPYVAPVSYVIVDDAICLRTGAGRRGDAIRANPRVCVETSRADPSTGDWESVIVWGNAVEIDDDSTAQRVISGLLEKYRESLGSPLSHGDRALGFAQPGILIAIPIDRITGRSSGSFFSLPTRPGRL